MALDYSKRLDVRRLLRELEDSVLELNILSSQGDANHLIVKNEVESELFHEGISKGEDELEIRFLTDHSEYKVEVEVKYLPKSLKVKVYRKR